MKARIKSAVGTLLLVSAAIFVIYQIITLHNYTRDWLGDSFPRISGLCTAVHCNDDLNRRRYYIEIDHGESYYYYVTPSFSDILIDDVYALQNKHIEAISLPAKPLSYTGMVVSLELDGHQVLEPQHIYKEFRGIMIIGIAVTIPYMLILLPCLLYIVIAMVDEGKSYCKKQQRKKQKAEKIERLRAEGKLHPSKQLQKKQGK